MKKTMLTITLLMVSLTGFTHGVDISSMVLVEQEDKTWTLQIRSSLDAYRKEVKTHFSNTPYTTPEEFKLQLLAHFQKNLKILINSNQQIPLGHPIVQLGHETVVYYGNIKLPTNINAIKIIATMFEDVNMSKVKLLILKKGYNKKPFILNKKNNYTADLLLKEKSFVLNDKESKSLYYLPIVIGIFLLIIFSTLRLYKKKSLTRSL